MFKQEIVTALTAHGNSALGTIAFHEILAEINSGRIDFLSCKAGLTLLKDALAVRAFQAIEKEPSPPVGTVVFKQEVFQAMIKMTCNWLLIDGGR